MLALHSASTSLHAKEHDHVHPSPSDVRVTGDATLLPLHNSEPDGIVGRIVQFALPHSGVFVLSDTQLHHSK